jgi:hypothetical protein
MRRLCALLATAGLFIALIGPANAGKPKAVFEDAAGDAGNQGTAVPGADQAGFDITGGSIAKVGKNLEFTTAVAAMPPTGALPEGFRYLWHFNVDGEEYRFTIKSQDIGKPDPVAQSGTERVGRIDTEGHFRLEQCFIEETPAIQLSQCNAMEYLEGAFDLATATFTAIVPMSLIKAKTGSVITGGTGGASGTGCQICWVPHYGERSLTPHTIIDSAAQAVTYKVPKK